MEIALYIIALTGLVFIITDGDIFEPLRSAIGSWAQQTQAKNNWLSKVSLFLFGLIVCPQCVGFHVGWIASVSYQPILNPLLDGFTISLCGYIIANFTKE